MKETADATILWFTEAFSVDDLGRYAKSQGLPSDICPNRSTCKSKCCKKVDDLWMYASLDDAGRSFIYLKFGEQRYCMSSEHCEGDTILLEGVSETLVIVIVSAILVCILSTIGM